MDLFDECGNYVGTFVEKSVNDVKEKAEHSFGEGLVLIGLALCLMYPIWGILIGSLYLIFKIVLWVLKITFKISFWILRLPFMLIFYHEFPEF